MIQITPELAELLRHTLAQERDQYQRRADVEQDANDYKPTPLSSAYRRMVGLLDDTLRDLEAAIAASMGGATP